jgi:hypothetical protein
MRKAFSAALLISLLGYFSLQQRRRLFQSKEKPHSPFTGLCISEFNQRKKRTRIKVCILFCSRPKSLSLVNKFSKVQFCRVLTRESQLARLWSATDWMWVENKYKKNHPLRARESGFSSVRRASAVAFRPIRFCAK